jgi:hypothetical protein
MGGSRPYPLSIEQNDGLHSDPGAAALRLADRPDSGVCLRRDARCRIGSYPLGVYEFALVTAWARGGRLMS